jgi:hypothetical protein
MAFWIVAFSLAPTRGWAVERVTIKHVGDSIVGNGGPVLRKSVKNPDQYSIVGEMILEGQDGGLMIQGDDGRIWRIQPSEILSHETDDQPLKIIDAEAATQRILNELPDGFQVYRTTNYNIVHNTREAYVRHVGTLFEQLHKGFFAYWKNQRWELDSPKYPLVALVFADQRDFLRYAEAEVGETAKSLIGYYHLGTNRMTTFDVPNLERNIATIIHEATHQLSYNVGLQRRFADNPMWVSEGMATFFEAPDFNNPKGWRTIGRVNQVNLTRWRNYLPQRPAESLTTLLANDTRFRSPATATASYAEAWALTYFLLKTKRDEYVKYLRLLSEGRPLMDKTPRERIECFEQTFGKSLADLDQEFLTYLQRVR